MGLRVKRLFESQVTIRALKLVVLVAKGMTWVVTPIWIILRIRGVPILVVWMIQMGNILVSILAMHWSSQTARANLMCREIIFMHLIRGNSHSREIRIPKIQDNFYWISSLTYPHRTRWKDPLQHRLLFSSNNTQSYLQKKESLITPCKLNLQMTPHIIPSTISRSCMTSLTSIASLASIIMEYHYSSWKRLTGIIPNLNLM